MIHMQKETNCPCCNKHCSVEELRCRRGMEYFNNKDILNEQSLNDESENELSQEIANEDFEQRLYKQIRACGRFLHHQGGRKAGQHRILTNLYENGKMTQRELQDIIDVKSGSLSEILNKVESHGYIQRSKNEHDKRLMDLELTSAGREAAVRMNKEEEEFRQLLFVSLNEDEKEQLSTLLEKLLDNWKESMNELEDNAHRGGHRGGAHRGRRHRGGNYHDEDYLDEGHHDEDHRGEGHRGEGHRGEDLRGKDLRGEDLHGERHHGEGHRGENHRGGAHRGGRHNNKVRNGMNHG